MVAGNRGSDRSQVGRSSIPYKCIPDRWMDGSRSDTLVSSRVREYSTST